MSVLADAISVIVSRTAIDKAYPGGWAGFERDAPRDTTCTDGYLARAGFLAAADAEYFLRVLGAAGLAVERGGIAVDAVLVDQNLGAARPCLWLELGRERDGTRAAWHSAARRGTLHVPACWEPARGRRVGEAAGRAFGSLVRYLKTEDSVDWYHDRGSGRLVSMARPFTAH